MAGSADTKEPAPGRVIDASVTMPWFSSDEPTPFTEALLDALGDQPVWVPVCGCSSASTSCKAAAGGSALMPYDVPKSPAS